MRCARLLVIALLAVAGCKKPPVAAPPPDDAGTSIFATPQKVKQQVQGTLDEEEKRRDRKLEEMQQ